MVMDQLLTQLRAAAEPTRLRLLALCARHPLCVTDLCAVLGQSQPRLSRHLRLLVEAGLLERIPEGSNAYFQMPAGAEIARLVLARLPEGDPLLAADRRAAARLAAERAREASDAFRRHGMDWDEMRALDLPAAAIEQALLDALPPRLGALLDIGTGTGRLLELVAPRADRVLGVDMSRDMLALARARLAERGLADRAAVRQADMYRLPFADAAFDAATCIGCGACVAACKNASAMLFVGAKAAHLNILPQGHPEKDKRVLAMVRQMDAEGFGNCTNHYECEAVCPKEISADVISKLNRDYAAAIVREAVAE
jgi:SAM-dependent methyltransferase